MNREDVQQLAQLARLSLTDQQCDGYLKDFQSIFSYIDAINTVDIPETEHHHVLTNMVREDDEVYEAGSFTEDILQNAPHKENGYVKVDKIL